MLTQKLIFFTLPRSASSYMCDLARACMRQLGIEHLNVNPEITNIDAWQSNAHRIIDDNKELINSLGLDHLIIDHNLIKTLFLHYVANPTPIVLKYFPFDRYSIQWDEFIAVVKRHNIRVICLYRMNILDYLISQIVIDNINNFGVNKDDWSANTEYVYNIDILDRITILHYELFFKFYTEFTNAGIIEKTVAYEDMLFKPKKDAALLFDDVKLKPHTSGGKFISKRLKTHILKQHPNIVSDLIVALKSTDLPIVNDYYLDLPL